MAATVLAFLQIFISDLHFDIAEDIDEYLGIDELPESTEITEGGSEWSYIYQNRSFYPLCKFIYKFFIFKINIYSIFL